MGRHRSDPRGLARILIAAVAVALALALLVVGVIALVNAITSESAGPGPDPSASPATSAVGGGTRTKPPTDTAKPPLQITVTGAATRVFVRVAGLNGTVLTQGIMNTGESRKFEQAPLDVVVDDAAAVDVLIYGVRQKPPAGGGRGTWQVPER